MSESEQWDRDVALSIFKGASGAVRAVMYALGKTFRSPPLQGVGLRQLAQSALEDGNLATAERYARELVALGEHQPPDWNAGNALHHGHLLLGEIALARDDRTLAGGELIAAAKVPASPQLQSFGPNMRLALALLNIGMVAPVLEYLELCRPIWKSGGAKIDAWAAAVRAGERVNFGANVLY